MQTGRSWKRETEQHKLPPSERHRQTFTPTKNDTFRHRKPTPPDRRAWAAIPAAQAKWLANLILEMSTTPTNSEEKQNIKLGTFDLPMEAGRGMGENGGGERRRG